MPDPATATCDPATPAPAAPEPAAPDPAAPDPAAPDPAAPDHTAGADVARSARRTRVAALGLDAANLVAFTQQLDGLNRDALIAAGHLHAAAPDPAAPDHTAGADVARSAQQTCDRHSREACFRDLA